MRLYAMSTPKGEVGPYSESRTSPATIVGNAKGRSISTSTTDRPGKLSRTSTHAIRVPMTRLMSATITEAPTVNFSVAQASGLCTARQNVSGPSEPERHTTAAKGMNTITLKKTIETPRPSPVPRLPASREADRSARLGGDSGASGRAFGGGGSAARPVALAVSVDTRMAPLAGRHADGLLDLGHDAAARLEELLIHLRPTAEVSDGEPTGRGREARARYTLDDGSVAVRGEDLLSLRRVQEVQERLRLGGVGTVPRHGHRVLDQNRRV